MNVTRCADAGPVRQSVGLAGAPRLRRGDRVHGPSFRWLRPPVQHKHGKVRRNQELRGDVRATTGLCE
eukprot:2842295-Prymnesium_polylepis.1